MGIEVVTGVELGLTIEVGGVVVITVVGGVVVITLVGVVTGVVVVAGVDVGTDV